MTSLGSSTYEPFKSRDLGYSSYVMPSTFPSQDDVGNNYNYVKVKGFQGIYGSSDTPERKDFYYGTSGSLDCQSYGYSNSQGFLCLNNDQKQMLMTRGGNATGVDSQIGAY